MATYSDPENIEIVGTPEFKKAMRDALELLKDKAPEDYRFVGMYTKKIVLENNTYPRAGICSMTTYIPKIFKPDPYWWAGILRHEAQHSKQMYSANDDVTITEPEAYEVELETLIKIGAPRNMIESAREWIKTKGWEQH